MIDIIAPREMTDAERESWLHQNPEWQELMREATSGSVYFASPNKKTESAIGVLKSGDWR